MADGLGGLLTQKIGPAPGWLWALGIGGVAFLVGPKLLKGGSSTPSAQPGTFDPQSFEAGFAQGAMYQPQNPSAPGQSAPPPTPIQWQADSPKSMEGFDATHSRFVGGASGAGGATAVSRNRSASVGSISADPHAYFHPSVKRVPMFAHFVRGGVGGAPVAHATAVHQLAHQAELHPARLRMLNIRPHRFVRVA